MKSREKRKELLGEAISYAILIWGAAFLYVAILRQLAAG